MVQNLVKVKDLCGLQRVVEGDLLWGSAFARFKASRARGGTREQVRGCTEHQRASGEAG